MRFRECTCGGTEPGWPRHESFCDTLTGHADHEDDDYTRDMWIADYLERTP